jgi:hypothetical protein
MNEPVHATVTEAERAAAYESKGTHKTIQELAVA